MPCRHGVTSTSDCGNAELCYGVIIRSGNNARVFIPAAGQGPHDVTSAQGLEASEQTGTALSQGFFPKAVRRSDEHPCGGRWL